MLEATGRGDEGSCLCISMRGVMSFSSEKYRILGAEDVSLSLDSRVG